MCHFLVGIPSQLKMNEDLQIETSHSWQEEEPEAKARWFQSLTLAERMEGFSACSCRFPRTELKQWLRTLPEGNRAGTSIKSKEPGDARMNVTASFD